MCTTPMTTLRVRVIGQSHQVKKKKIKIMSHLTVWQVIFEVKGHRGQVKGHLGQDLSSTLKVKVEGQGHQVKNIISNLI